MYSFGQTIVLKTEAVRGLHFLTLLIQLFLAP